MICCRPKKRRSGIATVEFAVILPVVALLIFGTIEICSMLFLKQSLKLAAYEATRVALVPRSTNANVQAAANTILSPRNVRNAVVTITPSNFQDAPFGTFIHVTISAPCDSNSVINAIFFRGRTFTESVDLMKDS